MNDEIQDLVDGLAERLGRPVGVDDRRFRAIAYSSHDDEIDPVRRTSILGRQAPPGVTAWLGTLDLDRRRGYTRVPANEELDMVARVCVPLAFRERVLGFLWLVEHDTTLEDRELSAAQECAAELAEALFRLQQQRSAERRLEAEAVERLIDGARPAPAVGHLAAAVAYVAVVIEVDPAQPGAGAAAIEVRLTEALAQVRRTAAPRHQLASVRDGRAVVLLAVESGEEAEQRARALDGAVDRELATLDGVTAIVGVGGVCERSDDLPASYRQAALAVGVGRSVRDVASPVLWEQLDEYRLVVTLLGDRDPAALIPPTLRRLLDADDADRLVTTLSAYLEHGGDAAATAAALYLHRSSLYPRLHRIEQAAGVDLRSGAARLELHLGLRLWRLAGGTTTVERGPEHARRDADHGGPART